MKLFVGAALAVLMFAASAHAQTPSMPGVSSSAPVAPAASAAPAAPAAPNFDAAKITSINLGHDTYMLGGIGGNMTLAVGKDGAILVDDEFAPLHDKIRGAVEMITPLPIKYVVNTHYHGDHTGGNALLAADGAEIVGQTNLKKRLAEGVTNALTGAKTPPAPAAALPTKVYNNAMSLSVKGRTAQLKHIPNAHTDGDTYVYFKDANVIATGDIVTVGGRYPNIDVAVGGNINGMIAGANEYLRLSNDTTKVVPGHGGIMSKVEVEAYRDMLVAARDAVQALIKEGKSEDEAVAAKPLAALDKRTGATEQGSANFVKLVYRSLKAAK